MATKTKYDPAPGAPVIRKGVTVGIGPHLLCCASITAPSVDVLLDNALADRKALLLYSDPPWGDGHLRYWSTLNRKMTGNTEKPISYEALIQRLLAIIARHVDGYVMLETGPRWGDQLATSLEQAGLFSVRQTPMRYSGGQTRLLDCLLVEGTTAPEHRLPDQSSAEGLSGYGAVREAIRSVARPGASVIDPCCGMGYTARAALETGMRFIGSELNARRLQVTANRLAAAV